MESNLRKASTVILIKKMKSNNYNWKLLLVKRHGKARFMSNMWVFPGGVNEKGDEDRRWEQLLNKEIDSSISNKICAIREVFEETGILLKKEKGTLNIGSEWRKTVEKDASSFFDLYKENKIEMEIDSLKDWCVIITPKVEKYRYNTNFYIKVVDDDCVENVSVDNREVTNHIWLSPSEAIENFEKGEIMLAPPTWAIIKDLLRIKDYNDIQKEERCLDPILPTLLMEENGMYMVLPGDKDYEDGYSEKEGIHRVLFSRDPKCAKYFCRLNQKQKKL
eukprot:TRINITY_DN17297_c0_g1_i1.p1 TRINITY_DN17297_c0_g1~~TRINITY_DN17297_c0_g1_i1.p1  ORF type:complete len:304 (+),score=89.04 TRINITY_DN17297_c0_g1_i1:82-912(+)